MKRILFIVLLYPLSLLAGPGQIGGGGSSSGGPTNGLTAAQVTAAMQAYNTTSTIPIPNSTLSVSATTAGTAHTYAVSNSTYKVYNVADFGAVPSGKIANDCWMTAGSPTLIIKNNYGDKSAFSTNDVGKSIMVYYAGWPKPVPYGVVPTTNYLALVGIIIAVNNATNITLSTNALHT